MSTCPLATGRSIGAIAIDPADANHIFIGTDVARHGSSSVNGGRFTPPGSAMVGLYESTDGGATFTAAEILTQDVTNPASANGSDFFRGGCSHIELYRPGSETQVYASFFDYGVFRRSVTLDGNSNFNQIFKSAGGGTLAQSPSSRTEFSLAPISRGPNKGQLRIYVGDAPAPASFWRVDNANVTAATLLGGNNGGWTKLSNSTKGTPGFSSYNYCTGQCTYDMPVYSPPGSPDIVYIGGAMQYGEIFTANRPSNGRAGDAIQPERRLYRERWRSLEAQRIVHERLQPVQLPRPDGRRRDRLPDVAVEDPDLHLNAQQRTRHAPVPEPVRQRQQPVQ